jgi:hypothetical protein
MDLFTCIKHFIKRFDYLTFFTNQFLFGIKLFGTINKCFFSTIQQMFLVNDKMIDSLDDTQNKWIE